MQDQTLRSAGPYEIIRKIADGGMASVHLARHSELDRYVALKVLHSLPSDDPELAARFINEARVVSSLSHPNIVTTHDYFAHEGRAYIAMEYLPDGSLRPHLRGLELAQMAGILECVLSGLRHAHSHGIIHRDIKPENVLVGDNGVSKLADFGIAKALNSVADSGFRTRTGRTFGTPAYMAPEQALTGEATVRTDLYSIGVMTYEIATGQLPYGGEERNTPMQILLGHIQGDCVPPDDLVPTLDPRVADWIKRMMAREPEDRPAGPDEAWNEFEDVVVASAGPLWRRESGLALEGLGTEIRSTHVSGFVTLDPQLGHDNGAPHAEPATASTSDPPPMRKPMRSLGSLEIPTVVDEPPVSTSAFSSDGDSVSRETSTADQPSRETAVAGAASPSAAAKRRVSRRALLASGATVLALGVGGVAYAATRSNPAPVVDVKPAAAQIRKQVAFQQPVSAVRCPNDVPRRPGVRFACTVALAGTDQRLIATVRERSVGHNDVQIRLAD